MFGEGSQGTLRAPNTALKAPPQEPESWRDFAECSVETLFIQIIGRKRRQQMGEGSQVGAG